MAATANIQSVEEIERDFKAKVISEISLVPEGLNRFVVDLPMTFDDGDALPIVLKKEGDAWVLTDEAHTFMQLSYALTDEELRTASRREIIDRALANFSVENRNGELVLPIPGESYGDALYSFIQTLLKVDAVRYLSRERVQSTFVQDVKHLLESVVASPERIAENWHHPNRDPQGIYPVDYRVNGIKKPVFIFALNSETKTEIATATLLRFELWKLDYKSVGIFDEMENFSQKTVARFIDACGKAFSNLDAAKENLPRFVPELVSAEA